MSTSLNESLLSQYEELKVLVESLQTDIVKHAGGNNSAGIRARKGLREAKKLAATIVKASIEASKTK